MPLQEVTEEKDLGVIFERGLVFYRHILEKTKKANRICGMIRRTFKFLDQDMFITLYKTMIRPHLEYCSSVWNPYHLKDIRRLEKVQRRATKMVQNLRHMDYPNRLRTLGLPTLEYRRQRADMIQVYKIMAGLEDMEIDNLFQISTSRTRGHTLRIHQKRARTMKHNKSFSMRVVTTWNNLPEEVVTAESVNSFKTKLNNHWSSLENKFNPS